MEPALLLLNPYRICLDLPVSSCATSGQVFTTQRLFLSQLKTERVIKQSHGAVVGIKPTICASKSYRIRMSSCMQKGVHGKSSIMGVVPYRYSKIGYNLFENRADVFSHSFVPRAA